MPKIITTISLFVFWAVVTAILAVGLVYYKNSNSPVNPDIANNATSSSTTIVKSFILNSTEIAKHNSLGDCWLLINNKVYNVTSYLSSHPGGVGTMTPYCGREATAAFDTKDIGKPHSASATSMLVQYFIGNLNQNIGPTPTTPAKTTKPAVTPPTNKIPTPTPIPTPVVTPTNTNIVLNTAEVAKHNSASNCWMIISGKVYNFTSFISSHPGGSSMVPYCGLDGTSSFLSGPPHAHSTFSQSLLSQYYVGNLNQTTNTQQIQQNTQNTNTVTPPVIQREDDDD